MPYDTQPQSELIPQAEPSARELNHLDYIMIRDNPIIRAGVFPYRGEQLPGGVPGEIYQVYRPLEELTKPETLASFVGLPIVDEHEMLGGKYERGPEERGVHGAVLESINVSGDDILAPIRIFSRTLKRLIDSGKKGLSLGYNCVFEKSCGAINGIAYNYIQRDIRGNHLALVAQGRNGTAVLDQWDVMDEFDLALDNMEENAMEDEVKKSEDGEINLQKVHEFLKEHAPMWDELKKLMGDGAVAVAEEAEEAAESALDEEKCDEKKDAMDSAAINSLLDKRLNEQRRAITKSLLSDVSARDKLAKSLEPHIGTFACDAMDVNDVAAYGVEKLGLKAVKGQEQAVLAGYLAGVAKTGAVTFAMDTAPKPKQGGLLAARLGQKA